jgi:hypothetical protein
MTESNLLDLLVLWWRYESQYNPVAGYPPECPSTMGYRPSRQYDDANGAFETDSRGKLAQAVGQAVNSLPRIERIALYTLARNRATGEQEWCGATLPADETERARLVARALDHLGVLV